MGIIPINTIGVEMDQKSFFIEGRNCWRQTRADEMSFLVDCEAYYKAFKEAALKARECILILSWDIDHRILLRHDEDDSGFPNELGDFLSALLDQRPDLHIYILNFDFSIAYAFERITHPVFNLSPQSKPRFHFRLDSAHPFVASQHQKVVVIDDAVAFSGGIDLSHSRWDTPAHEPRDPRRTDPGGTAYNPFHDIQVIVKGPAARDLGDLARERWALATGETVKPVKPQNDPWPSYLVPDMKQALLAISRTLPAFMDRPEVREVETLFMDMIASAQHFIYIEQQYLTSVRISELLAARLKEENGPEVLLILPESCSGWVEESTMGLLRTNFLWILREADVHGRFGAYHPVVSDNEELVVNINVHSKIMVVDDRMVRVGSANLSNRSLGLDTECDVTIASEGDPEREATIARFRNVLLGEHLGASPERVGEAISSKNSLIQAVESLRGSKHTLRPLSIPTPEWRHRLFPPGAFFDLERPLDRIGLIEEFVPADEKESGGRPLLRGAIYLAVLILLAGIWKWSPIKEWFDFQTLVNWAEAFQGSPLSLPVVIGAYIIGGLIMFPVLLLIFVTTFTFQPLVGILYSLVGCFSSAIVGYFVGKLIGRDLVRRLAGARLNQIGRRLAHHGMEAIIVLRIVPLLPFTVVNLVAGASHLALKDYILGTVIGMTPGIFLITFFQASLSRALSSPGVHHFVILIIVAAAILAGSYFLTRWINRASYVKFLFTRLRKRKKKKRKRWFSGRNQKQTSP